VLGTVNTGINTVAVHLCVPVEQGAVCIVKLVIVRIIFGDCEGMGYIGASTCFIRESIQTVAVPHQNFLLTIAQPSHLNW